MEETKKAEIVNARTELKRVILDTPALLSMVKHCREAHNAQGFLMGVTEKDYGETIDSLHIDQTIAKSSKAKMSDLIATLAKDQ